MAGGITIGSIMVALGVDARGYTTTMNDAEARMQSAHQKTINIQMQEQALSNQIAKMESGIAEKRLIDFDAQIAKQEELIAINYHKSQSDIAGIKAQTAAQEVLIQKKIEELRIQDIAYNSQTRQATHKLNLIEQEITKTKELLSTEKYRKNKDSIAESERRINVRTDNVQNAQVKRLFAQDEIDSKFAIQADGLVTRADGASASLTEQHRYVALNEQIIRQNAIIKTNVDKINSTQKILNKQKETELKLEEKKEAAQLKLIDLAQKRMVVQDRLDTLGRSSLAVETAIHEQMEKGFHLGYVETEQLEKNLLIHETIENKLREEIVLIEEKRRLNNAGIAQGEAELAVSRQRLTNLSAEKTLQEQQTLAYIERLKLQADERDYRNRERVGNGMLLAGGIEAGATAGAIAYGAEWNKQLLDMAHNTSLTDDEVKKMRQTINDFSLESGTKLEKTGEGFRRLENYSFGLTNTIDLLRVAMKGAVGTGSDLDTTAELIAKSMKDWELPMSEAPKLMNLMVLAANRSTLEMKELVHVGGQVYNMAAAFGIPFTEANAMLVTFTKYGLNAAEAATQLRGVIQRLQDPTEKVRNRLESVRKETGIDLAQSFSIAALRGQGLVAAFDKIREAAGKYKGGVPTQDLAAALFPAQRGTVGAIIAGKGLDSLHEELKVLQDAYKSGLDPVTQHYNETINTTYQETQRLSVATKILASEMDNVFRTQTSFVLSGLTQMTKGLSESSDETKQLYANLILTTTALLIAGGAVVKFNTVLISMTAAQKVAGLAAGTFTGTLKTVAVQAALIVGSVALLTYAYTEYNRRVAENAKLIEDATPVNMAKTYLETQKHLIDLNEEHIKTRENIVNLVDSYDSLTKISKQTNDLREKEQDLLNKISLLAPGLIEGYNRTGQAIGLNKQALYDFNSELNRSIQLWALQQEQTAKGTQSLGHTQLRQMYIEQGNAIDAVTKAKGKILPEQELKLAKKRSGSAHDAGTPYVLSEDDRRIKESEQATKELKHLQSLVLTQSQIAEKERQYYAQIAEGERMESEIAKAKSGTLWAKHKEKENTLLGKQDGNTNDPLSSLKHPSKPPKKEKESDADRQAEQLLRELENRINDQNMQVARLKFSNQLDEVLFELYNAKGNIRKSINEIKGKISAEHKKQIDKDVESLANLARQRQIAEDARVQQEAIKDLNTARLELIHKDTEDKKNYLEKVSDQINKMYTKFGEKGHMNLGLSIQKLFDFANLAGIEKKKLDTSWLDAIQSDSERVDNKLSGLIEKHKARLMKFAEIGVVSKETIGKVATQLGYKEFSKEVLGNINKVVVDADDTLRELQGNNKRSQTQVWLDKIERIDRTSLNDSDKEKIQNAKYYLSLLGLIFETKEKQNKLDEHNLEIMNEIEKEIGKPKLNVGTRDSKDVAEWDRFLRSQYKPQIDGKSFDEFAAKYQKFYEQYHNASVFRDEQKEADDLTRKLDDVIKKYTQHYSIVAGQIKVTTQLWKMMTEEQQKSVLESISYINNVKLLEDAFNEVNTFALKMFDDLRENGFKNFFKDIIAGFEDMLYQMAVKWAQAQITSAIEGFAQNFIGNILGGIEGVSGGSGASLDSSLGAGSDIPAFNSGGLQTVNRGVQNLHIHIHASDAQSVIKSKTQIAQELRSVVSRMGEVTR